MSAVISFYLAYFSFYFNVWHIRGLIRYRVKSRFFYLVGFLVFCIPLWFGIQQNITFLVWLINFSLFKFWWLECYQHFYFSLMKIKEGIRIDYIILLNSWLRQSWLSFHFGREYGSDYWKLIFMFSCQILLYIEFCRSLQSHLYECGNNWSIFGCCRVSFDILRGECYFWWICLFWKLPGFFK